MSTIASPPANSPLQPGAIGVYPVGALAMAFHERLRADAIVCRRTSATTDWITSVA